MSSRLSNEGEGQTSRESKKAMASKVAPGMQWVRFIVPDYSLPCASWINDVGGTMERVGRSDSGREGVYLRYVATEL